MARTRMLNGVEVPFTPKEETQANADAAMYQEYRRLNGYKDNREAAYAPVQEQLDMMYWDQVNGTTTWKDHVAAVRAAYPKPA